MKFNLSYLLIALLSSAVRPYQTPRVGQDHSIQLFAKATTHFQHVISHDDGVYIAPHFSFIDIPTGATLTISALDGSQGFNYTGTQNEFYANYVRGSKALLTYTPPTNIHGLDGQNAFLIDGYASSAPDTDPESICGNDNSESAICFKDKDPKKYETSQAIARLFIGGTSLCTGWLFGSEGHMITNNHCIYHETWARNVQVEFGAECKKCDTPAQESQEMFSCPGTVVAKSVKFIHTNAALDYTLVKLNLLEGASLAPFGYLQARESGPVLNEPIYIAEHPSGRPRRIAAITDNGQPGVVASMSLNRSCVKDEIGYHLDTQGGASGSPVLSATGHIVVALHNCGGCMNGAVKIDKIVRDLSSLNLLPLNALANDVPVPTSYPSSSPQSTKAPKTTTPLPTSSTSSPSTKSPSQIPTTPRPIRTKTPTDKPNPSRTQQPTETPLSTTSTMPPTTMLPNPIQVCGTCKGCYFADVKWCLLSGVSKNDCERANGFWCGK